MNAEGKSVQKAWAALLMLLPVVSSFLLPGMCPHPDTCECGNGLINCTCNARQTVRFSNILDYDIQEIWVEGCGTVMIPLASMAHLSLQKLVFRDLQELHLRPFALTGMTWLGTLLIENVEKLNLEAHGLSGLSNVSSIVFRNVSVEVLLQAALRDISSVQEIEISDSFIGTVEPLAVIVSNVTELRILRTSVDSLLNTSFYLQDVGRFSIDHSQLRYITNGSIFASKVESIEIDNSNISMAFGDIVVAKDLENFKFRNNSVGQLGAHAFWFLEPSTSTEFSGNRFALAEEDSLIPNLGPHSAFWQHVVLLELHSNSFACGCQLHWLWTSGIYAPLQRSSTCYQPPELAGMRLSHLQTKVTDNGTCDAIVADPSLLSTANSYETVGTDADDHTGHTDSPKDKWTTGAPSTLASTQAAGQWRSSIFLTVFAAVTILITVRVN